MASNIDGALYREVTGPAAAPLMVFVHPNPMDNAAWMYQLAHLSTWYRCVAVDLPGYGRSPRAVQGVTLSDLAEACWDAVAAEGDDPVVLVGCSVGANVVLHMQHLFPERTAAVVVSGAGYATDKPHLQRHIDAYRHDGVEYRHGYALQDFSADFRATPLAEWMAGLWAERNEAADVPSILAMFDALIQGDPPWFADVQAPVLILTGSEDAAHQRAFALRDHAARRRAGHGRRRRARLPARAALGVRPAPSRLPRSPIGTTSHRAPGAARQALITERD